MIKTGKELAAACVDVAKKHKTIYVLGCFGAPMTGANVERYCNNYPYNQKAERTAMIKARANQNPPYYGFDCVCLIKGLLWGWNGTAAHTYGGASYQANGVPDIGADQMIQVCKDVSTDFSKIEVGEAVWMEGHIGIYVGDGLAVECTPKWNNCVQITACNTSKSPYHRRDWTKHGKLPYVEYPVETVETPEPETQAPALAVGDVVNFTGNRHYVSANSGTGHKCNPGKAKITAIYRLGESQHPYHLVKEPGGGSTVYGWVDAEDIEPPEPEKEPEPETPAPPAEPCNLSLPTLKKGAKGDIVRAMQILLMGYGYDMEGYGADGSYGGKTENAVTMYQDKNGLPVTGICDLQTWNKLLGA